MGFREWVARLRGETLIDGEKAFVIRDAEIASRIPQPTERGREQVDPCNRCGRPLEPHVITTGGPYGDPEVWDSAPLAVDGWVCGRCGVMRYPRTLSAETSVRYGECGADAARAGRWRDAEWWFTRIASAWPDYPSAYLDLASALRGRLDAKIDADREARRRVERRMQAAYERAIETGESARDRWPVKLLAAAYLGAAETALEQRAPDRARRALAACRALEGREAAQTARLEEVERYLDDERWIFADAAAVLKPYLQLQDAPGAPIETPEVRAACAQAVDDLEALYDRHPAHWQSIWLAAMGSAALGRSEATLALWRRAWRDHPDRSEIIREYCLALLRRDLVEEAVDVDRDATKRFPDDATLWCNRAVTEVLCGHLDEARRCVRESQRLDPSDRITQALARRLDGLSEGGPLPRTLSELERRA